MIEVFRRSCKDKLLDSSPLKPYKVQGVNSRLGAENDKLGGEVRYF